MIQWNVAARAFERLAELTDQVRAAFLNMRELCLVWAEDDEDHKLVVLEECEQLAEAEEEAAEMFRAAGQVEIAEAFEHSAGIARECGARIVAAFEGDLNEFDFPAELDDVLDQLEPNPFILPVDHGLGAQAS